MLSRGNFLNEPYLREKEMNYKFKQYWSLDCNEGKVIGQWPQSYKIVLYIDVFQTVMCKLQYPTKTFFRRFTFIIMTLFCVYLSFSGNYMQGQLHPLALFYSIVLVSICSFFPCITKHIADIVERLHGTFVMFCTSRFYSQCCILSR